MKPKEFDRKLTLNKKTISNLQNGEMKDVHGGRPRTYPPCATGNTCTCDPSNYPVGCCF